MIPTLAGYAILALFIAVIVKMVKDVTKKK